MTSPQRPTHPAPTVAGNGVDPAIYGLADDADVTSTPWRAAPGKRVRTTLGRDDADARPDARPDGRRRVHIDPNLQLAGALRPAVLQDARVRVVADPRGADYRGDEQLDFASGRPPRETVESFVRLSPLVPKERPAGRLLAAMVALGFAATFLWVLLGFWAPANTGVDQNGYLVGGKLLARSGTMSLVPESPYGFVGTMWVATEKPETGFDGQAVQEYFPKYPAGLPLLYAGFFWLAPSFRAAVEWAQIVSPVSAALGALGMFYLARFVGGSFLGLLAMLGLAGSQLMLLLADNPNSHVACLAFVVWGFVALLAWWRSGFFLWGVAGGFLLGYAFTIRYTEGLLGLPLGLACAFAWQPRRPFVSLFRVALPLVAWAVPVGGLLYYNWHTMGTLTGYDSTGEAGGFSLANAAANWENMAKQLNDGGLYFLLPLGVGGLLALLARRPRVGTVLLAWFVATVAVYTAYYWAPGNWGNTAYLRFFLTAFPAVLAGTAYLLRRTLYAPGDAPPRVVETRDPHTGRAAVALVEDREPRWTRIVRPVAAGLVFAAAVGLGTHRAVGSLPGTEGGVPFTSEPGMQLMHQLAANVAGLGRVVRQEVPAGSVVICDSPGMINNVLHHLQFAGDYELYDAAVFSRRFAGSVARGEQRAGDEDNPNPLQKRRYAFLHRLYDGKTDDDLSAAVRKIADRALGDGRGVYLVMSANDLSRFRRAHLSKDFDTTEVARFSYVPLSRPKPEQDEDEAPKPEQEARNRRRSKSVRPNVIGFVAAGYAAEGEWIITRVTREAPVPPATVPATTRAAE